MPGGGKVYCDHDGKEHKTEYGHWYTEDNRLRAGGDLGTVDDSMIAAGQWYSRGVVDQGQVNRDAKA
jgi:hypothetical protein